MTIADSDFAVRAQVNQRHQIFGGPHADGMNSGQNIRSNKTADAAQKAYAARRRQRPLQLLSGEALFAHVGGMKRRMRERLNIKPRKQMMHHRVADQDHLGNLALAAAGKFRDHLAQSTAHYRSQIGALQSRTDPTHHVRPERCLWIEIGLDSENAARGQVDHLCGDGGGA